MKRIIIYSFVVCFIWRQEYIDIMSTALNKPINTKPLGLMYITTKGNKKVYSLFNGDEILDIEKEKLYKKFRQTTCAGSIDNGNLREAK